MSKMDNLRAMREARYEAARAGAGTPRSRAVPKTQPSAPASSSRPDVVDEPAVEGLCGHRNMSGRTCTREKGHAAKSHRYS